MSDPGAMDQFTRAAEHASGEVINAYSTSFGQATRLLGARHRQHVRNIYALVRVADEIVDGVADEAGSSAQQKEDAFERFVDETHRAVVTGWSTNLIVHAFAQTARAAGIERPLTDAFFASMRTDLQRDPSGAPVRFDADAHQSYVYGSAEVVGLMCLRVFVRDERPDDRRRRKLERGARALGAAFQNINFLRDLADDTQRLGRNYLGDTDRLTDADRLAWVRTVRAQLSDAAETIPLLPHDARAAVRAASALFEAVADRIEAVPIERLYRERVRVPDPIKAGILARAVFATWMERRG